MLEAIKNFIIKSRELRVKENQEVYKNPWVILGEDVFKLLEPELLDYETTVINGNINVRSFEIKLTGCILHIYYAVNYTKNGFYIDDIGYPQPDTTTWNIYSYIDKEN